MLNDRVDRLVRPQIRASFISLCATNMKIDIFPQKSYNYLIDQQKGEYYAGDHLE
jgi:hypothetical protein